MAPSNSRSRLWFGIQLASALIGIALSLYLFWEHIRLQLGIQGGSALCSSGGFADCTSVNSSRFAKLGGIPLAALGVLYYLIHLSFIAFHGAKSKFFENAQRWVLWFAIAGFGLDLYLLTMQLTELHKICPLCLTTYVTTFLIGLGAFFNLRGSTSAASAKSIFMGPGGRPFRLPAGSWALTAICVLIVSASLYILPFTQVPSSTRPESAGNIESYIESFAKQKAAPLPSKPGDGRIGPANAPVQVVVFSDFECPFCKRAAFTLQDAVRPYPEHVSLTFKNYPLDSSCNPALEQPMHPNACKLAQLGYCAQLKGKFWQYHDLVYFELQDKGLNRSIAEIGSDMKPVFSNNEIRDCLASSASLDNTKQDVTLGNSLDIRSTPTVFINGKRVLLPLSAESMSALLRAELGVK